MQQPLLLDQSLVQKKQTSLLNFQQGIVLSINLLMGTAPFVLPRSFSLLGFIPSSMIFTFMMIISYISTEFYLETNNILGNVFQDENQYLELGQMAQKLYGRGFKAFVNAIVIIYLTGVLIVKVIIGSESLKFAIIDILNANQYWNFKSNWNIDLYHPALFFYITFSGIFIYLSQEKQQQIQKFIVSIRFITFSLIIYGCFYYIQLQKIPDNNAQKYYENIYQKLNNIIELDLSFKNLILLSSNSMYVFLLHHSLPVICRQIEPGQHRRILKYGMIIVSSILVLLCFLGIFAFGGYKNSCKTSFPCKISVLFNENFLDLNIIGNILNFYLVLSISAIPIQIEAVSNSICNAFDIKQSYKTVVKFGVFSIILTVAIFFKNNLSLILEIMGGLNGVFIVTIFPSLFLIQAKKLTLQKLDIKNEKQQSAYLTFDFKSLPYLIMIIGSIQILLTSYSKISY